MIRVRLWGIPGLTIHFCARRELVMDRDDHDKYTVDSVITHRCDNPYSAVTHSFRGPPSRFPRKLVKKPITLSYPVTHTFSGVITHRWTVLAGSLGGLWWSMYPSNGSKTIDHDSGGPIWVMNGQGKHSTLQFSKHRLFRWPRYLSTCSRRGAESSRGSHSISDLLFKGTYPDIGDPFARPLEAILTNFGQHTF